MRRAARCAPLTGLLTGLLALALLLGGPPVAHAAPLGVPSAPTSVTATRGDAYAVVRFTAPSDAGGSPITGYTVTVYPDGAKVPCTASPCQVINLSNGFSYTFTVVATNAQGDSVPSQPSAPVIPATVPSKPNIVTANSGNHSATVIFNPPYFDGGAAITSYTATSSPGGHRAVCSGSPCRVSGLVNGTSYTFTVHATNAVGSGPESDKTDPAKPVTVPSSPANVTAVPGDGSARIIFAESDDTGGSEILGYVVTARPGPAVANCSDTSKPCVVTGLTNGTSYVFFVRAVNASGLSRPSSPSDAVTPATTPGPPRNLRSTPAAGSAHLEFLAPLDDGGSAITGYEAATDGGESWELLVTSGTTPITATVPRLVNGHPYSIQVRARNAVGGGFPADGDPVTPVDKPERPTGVSGMARDHGVSLAWTVPHDNGSPITGYTVRVSPRGATRPCSSSTCVVTGLRNGTAYTFTVAARNPKGESEPSEPSEAVTPGSVLTAPQSLVVTPGDRVLGLTFRPPGANGGRPVSGYQVSLDRGRRWQPLAASGTATLRGRVVGVLNGQAYPVSVRAVNGLGARPASALVTVRTAAWFRDPVAPGDRAQEIDVPKNPSSYRGPLRHTKAASRSRTGIVAFPAVALNGRQLQGTEAVDLGPSLFGFDSAQLTVKGRALIKATTGSLRYVSAITCEGYADYAGRTSHEVKLSEQRASAVCVAVKTYAPQVTSRTVKAYGPSWPVLVGGTTIQRVDNRRVIVEIP